MQRSGWPRSITRWRNANTGQVIKQRQDDHTEIFPIGQNVLNVSTQLKQNPGY